MVVYDWHKHQQSWKMNLCLFKTSVHYKRLTLDRWWVDGYNLPGLDWLGHIFISKLKSSIWGIFLEKRQPCCSKITFRDKEEHVLSTWGLHRSLSTRCVIVAGFKLFGCVGWCINYDLAICTFGATWATYLVYEPREKIICVADYIKANLISYMTKINVYKRVHPCICNQGRSLVIKIKAIVNKCYSFEFSSLFSIYFPNQPKHFSMQLNSHQLCSTYVFFILFAYLFVFFIDNIVFITIRILSFN